jgi:hypothetical protein
MREMNANQRYWRSLDWKRICGERIAPRTSLLHTHRTSYCSDPSLRFIVARARRAQTRSAGARAQKGWRSDSDWGSRRHPTPTRAMATFGGHSYAWHLFEPPHPDVVATSPSLRDEEAEAEGDAAAAAAADAPAQQRRPFSRHQRVYVLVKSARDTGAATIEATPRDIARAGGPDAERWGGGETPRYRVRFDERDPQTGEPKRAHVRAARLQPVLRPPPPLPLRQPQAIVSSDTREFRRQARSQLSCGGRDLRVLEVGASTGEASAAIAQHAGAYASGSGESSEEEEAMADEEGQERGGRGRGHSRRRKKRVWAKGLVGVDLAAGALQQARRRVPTARFVLADVLADPQALLAKLLGRRLAARQQQQEEQEQPEGPPPPPLTTPNAATPADCRLPAVGAVLLDIGGKRAIADVLAAVEVVSRALRPELIIVKSEELAASARAWQRQRGATDEAEEEEEEWRGEGAPTNAVPDSAQWWLEAKERAAAEEAAATTTLEEEAGEEDAGGAAAPPPPPPPPRREGDEGDDGGSVEVPPWFVRQVVRPARRRAQRRKQQEQEQPGRDEDDEDDRDNSAWGGVRMGRLPMRFVAAAAPAADGASAATTLRPICRFSNYGACLREKAGCPFDHDHCHACLARGHRAIDREACPVARAAWAVATAATAGGGNPPTTGGGR